MASNGHIVLAGDLFEARNQFGDSRMVAFLDTFADQSHNILTAFTHFKKGNDAVTFQEFFASTTQSSS